MRKQIKRIIKTDYIGGYKMFEGGLGFYYDGETTPSVKIWSNEHRFIEEEAIDDCRALAILNNICLGVPDDFYVKMSNNKKRYHEIREIYSKNETLYSTSNLFGIAFDKYTTILLDDPNAILVSIRVSADPVLIGQSIYNKETGGWDDFKVQI